MFRKPQPPEAARPDTPHPDSSRPEPPLSRRFTDQGAHATVLLAGLRIKGDIEGEDSVEIAGALEGNLRIGGLCQVREGATVKGDIRARQVLIEGEVHGRRVEARERLELRSHARVRADLDAGSIALAEGCEFNGRIQMSGAVILFPPFEEKESSMIRSRPG